MYITVRGRERLKRNSAQSYILSEACMECKPDASPVYASAFPVGEPPHVVNSKAPENIVEAR